MVKMGDVWDRATEFLSDNLGPLLPLVLLSIYLPAVVQSNLTPLADTPGPAATIIQLVSLGLSLVMLWGQLAITALAIDPALNRDAATRMATRRLLPAIGIALALLAVVLLLCLPIVAALAVAGFDFQAAATGGSAEMPAGASIFVGLYSVVLVVAALWLGARMVLINPVIMGERRGIRSIARSFALTRGITWKIIGVMILFAVVAIVAVLAAKTVFGSILQLIAGGDGSFTVASVVTSVLVGLVSTAFTVLAAAFTAKLYLAVEPAPGVSTQHA